MKKEEVSFLNQLIESLDESEIKLEEAYEKKDYESFNRIKKFMLKIQNQIDEILR